MRGGRSCAPCGTVSGICGTLSEHRFYVIPLFRNCKISMDTYAKNLLKLVCCFGLFFSVLLFLLTAATAVPQTLIQKNMEESADILCENPRIYYMVPGVDGSQNHLYADAITLNIAYHLKDGSPLESVIWARYYTSASDVNESLRESVQGRPVIAAR